MAENDRGQILLQRRRDTGQWALPMGKQELGETVTDCAIRETKEEKGIDVEVTGLVGIFSDPAHIVAYTDGAVRHEYEDLARSARRWVTGRQTTRLTTCAG